ncbi:AAA family ATPase [Sporolituus thermophilus]|uniref:Predicted ATPase n=1 Tax=Sporolituus thermophilus DSM 23256 TaxID=1123285 RepID=A0A1G7JSF0_9FIRM|nr:ATP-binding protein [Sporolituus thermophilus]SDF27791.1 Predicted ATPase [Sporolituus thermophilus DSM 23256]
MIITRVVLQNWRNFRSVDVCLGDRVFLIGPNASGKSNFLDVFRFLRDIVKGGGLQQAIAMRGGMSKIRCLAARTPSTVVIDITWAEEAGEKELWRYKLGIKQEQRGRHQPIVDSEEVWCNGEKILDRPDKDDKIDNLRLTQTHLEQINANKEFRTIAEFFKNVQYLHLVPQIIRAPIILGGSGMTEDPFGQDFLQKLASATEATRTKRLRKIEEILRIAVPQLKNLAFVQDSETGKPHLEAVYEHWRSHGAKQREDQFSDGTIRLIGLLWSLLEKDSLLLLEEPELSLHSAIIRKLPGMMARLQRQNRRQIFISTHSFELLSDQGIGAEEILILSPDVEGTTVSVASSRIDILALLEEGVPAAEAVLPLTAPRDIDKM